MSELVRREFVTAYDCDGESMWDMGTREEIIRCRDCAHCFDREGDAPLCARKRHAWYVTGAEGFCDKAVRRVDR